MDTTAAIDMLGREARAATRSMERLTEALRRLNRAVAKRHFKRELNRLVLHERLQASGARKHRRMKA